MSLYNMLLGSHPAADGLLLILGLKRSDCGRFRDCYPSDDGNLIHIYTRNGGGNREHYMPDFSQHPQFVEDKDDTFDCTYATLVFRTPPEFVEMVKSIADKTNTTPPAERMAKLIADLQSGADNAVVARAKVIGKEILDALNQGQSKSITTPEGGVDIISNKNEDRQ